MGNSIWTAIDTGANRIAELSQVAGYSLDGLFESAFRQNPTIAGLRVFRVAAQAVKTSLLNQVLLTLQNALRDIESAPASLMLTGSDTAAGVVADTLGQFESYFTGLSLQHARRFRERLVVGQGRSPGELRPLLANGRRMSPTEWSFLTARKALLDSYNLTRLQDLHTRGATAFQVIYQNVEHEGHGEIYPMEDYPALADEVFHPRSTAVIGGGHVST